MSNRISLRDYQQDLARKLSAARAEPASALHLGVQCGSGLWLIPLVDAGEILPVPPLSRVPRTKPWYCGLANVRGTLVSVIDFSGFATGHATPRVPEARLVLVGARLGLNAALLVSRMLGLRNPRDFESSAAASRAAWEGGAWTDRAGLPWRELKLKALVADSGFLDVAA
ncbi:MAG: chemotaxis protein CheW [Burkholderiales bacterium]|nr:chemotaxis protein CheW [Burkholderiales bacterium]